MSQKQRAYDYLKNAIISSAIPAGSPVREMDVAETLSMSRTPIREAMRELETEGVLTSYPSRGTFVTALTPSDVEEIYELRLLHELWAIERSINRITVEELDFIERKFNEAFQLKDWDIWLQADKLLHRLIVEKSGSKKLLAFVNMLNTQIERIRKTSTVRDASDIERSSKEHMEIITLIRQRNLPKCREALRNHLITGMGIAIETSRLVHIDLEGAIAASGG